MEKQRYFIAQEIDRERRKQVAEHGDRPGLSFTDWLALLVGEVGALAGECVTYTTAATDRGDQLARIRREAIQVAAYAMAIAEEVGPVVPIVGQDDQDGRQEP